MEINGENYIDGGVVDNVPISRAVHLKAERVYVLHVGNFTRPRQLPKRPIDVLLQSFSIARNHRFLAETDEPPEGMDLVVLPAVDPGRIRRNDFSRSRSSSPAGTRHRQSSCAANRQQRPAADGGPPAAQRRLVDVLNPRGA